MSFAREQTGGWVEADPTRAGQVNFCPRVQIREILFRAARAIERFHVRLELDQITADKARSQAKMPHQLHQQPRGVAARAAHLGERFLWRLHAGLHADGVLDVFPQPLVDGDDEIVRRLFLAVGQFQPLLLGAAFDFANQVAPQFVEIF